MADTTGRLERARVRLLEIEGDLERLRVDRELARREIELLSGSPPPAGSRTDRIVAILDRLGEATPAQISGQLDLEEASVNPAAVRATLAHLLDQGRVMRARRGVYRLP